MTDHKDKPGSKEHFDHGGFWDSYSSRWDVHGDGDGVKHTGDDAVLGVEWTKDHRTGTVIEQHVLPFITPEHRVLEIGPGGGKFSRILQPLCAEFTLAAISPRMLKRAAEACAKPPKTIHLDGESLRPLEDDPGVDPGPATEAGPPGSRRGLATLAGEQRLTARRR